MRKQESSMEGESHLGCAHRDIEFQNISLLQKIKVEKRRKNLCSSMLVFLEILLVCDLMLHSNLVRSWLLQRCKILLDAT